ncbi:hypothetical protein [Streptomyces chartreusis]|uniref:hypothetical protein n=1 Tax=Streptomyces chartreusis TaxID=1969 RepID=UPI0036CC1B75
MALSQSDRMRLVESLRSTDGIELIRAIAEWMVQELQAEAAAYIGAEWNEPLTAFRTGALDHVRFPCVYVDATYCKAR